MNNIAKTAIHTITDTLIANKIALHVAATGAGAGLQDVLWSRPGMSDSLVEATFPYSERAATAFLGFPLAKSCDDDAAIHLAMAAYMRAWSPEQPNAIGLGLTAVVASTRARHEHRCYAATFSADGCYVAKIVLPRDVGEEARERDGIVCTIFGLRMLAEGIGLTDLPWSVPLARQQANARASSLLWQRPLFEPTGQRSNPAVSEALQPGRYALYPGAFNPPHSGHIGQARAYQDGAARYHDVVFAIETEPPNKAALSTAECLQRATMLRGQRVLFTRGQALYLDKARQHPNTPILLGADAAMRLVDPKWGPVEANLREFMALGTTFHVAGRMIGDVWTTVEHVRARVPHECWRWMFEETPGRWDVSSSALRAGAAS
jgi:hypothetical protein